MIRVSSADTSELAEALSRYEPFATVSRIAGLLTVPSLQANGVRLELLAHLAVARCAGKKEPSRGSFESWLNTNLARPDIVSLEDPAEDVFVTNIQTPDGNFRIFQGLWES